MTTDFQTIQQYLDNRKLKYEFHEAHSIITTGFGTERFTNRNGRNSVTIGIVLEEDGRVVRIAAPNLYQPAQPAHELTLMLACFNATWLSKFVEYRYSVTQEGNRYVDAQVEIPLEDAALTEKQFFRALLTLAQLVDELDPMVRGAAEQGEVQASGRGPVPADSWLELLQLVNAVGGLGQAKELLKPHMSQGNDDASERTPSE